MLTSGRRGPRPVEEVSSTVGEPAAPSRAQLVAALDESAGELLATVRGIDSAAWDQVPPGSGWTRHQLLAHVASIEWSYPRLIDLARQAHVRQHLADLRGTQEGAR